MSGFAHLTRKMFEALVDIKAGRFVYVIARKASAGKGVEIEDVIIDEIFNPKRVLERHCISKGIPTEGMLCLFVFLPPGLDADDVKGFRPVRTQKAIWIEYTKEGPERPDTANRTSTG